MRRQHCMVEEFDVLDGLHPTRMVNPCFINNAYFLAASIMCLLVKFVRISCLLSFCQKCEACWRRAHQERFKYLTK